MERWKNLFWQQTSRCCLHWLCDCRGKWNSQEVADFSSTLLQRFTSCLCPDRQGERMRQHKGDMHGGILPLAPLVVWFRAQHVFHVLSIRESKLATNAVGNVGPQRPAGMARQLLVILVWREERWRKCPEHCWGEMRGAGAEALEEARGTGVHSRSAGGRVTSPAWAQMALHMSQPLPETCPLRQHLRSLQGLAGTIQIFLSPAVTWIWKGGGSANSTLLFSALGRVTWWPCREQFLPATSSHGQYDSCR